MSSQGPIARIVLRRDDAGGNFTEDFQRPNSFRTRLLREYSAKNMAMTSEARPKIHGISSGTNDMDRGRGMFRPSSHSRIQMYHILREGSIGSDHEIPRGPSTRRPLSTCILSQTGCSDSRLS